MFEGALFPCGAATITTRSNAAQMSQSGTYSISTLIRSQQKFHAKPASQGKPLVRAKTKIERYDPGMIPGSGHD